MKTFYFSVINLWCSKNLVDIEFLVWKIFSSPKENSIDIKFFDTPEEKEVEYIIINTCWFLSSSREEAENILQEFDKKWKKIILMWCYIEVKNDIFLSSLKNLFAIIPQEDSKNLKNIFENPSLQILKDKLKEKNFLDHLKTFWWKWKEQKAFLWQGSDQRAYFYADYSYEYLKISEWCDNNCTFCIIPQIRGKQTSRTIEDILLEVKNMLQLWIQEIQIIAQDTTRYGIDIYGEPKLVELLQQIDQIEWDFTYRLYYMYPDSLTKNHLIELSHLKKMIPYFDIPLQHIAPNVLKKMGRFYDEIHIYSLLDDIKKLFPKSFLHTNCIVWFPWETEWDFNKLKDFLIQYKFDSVSMFGYHDEPLATSSKLPQKIDDTIIQIRVAELREILENIYDKKYEARREKKHIWYIHEIQWKKCFIRSELFAPEIDDYDVVPLKNILQWNIEIGEKVVYYIK